jgi:hydrogenase maturation protease
VRDPLPPARGRPVLRLIGVGNRFRGDDAAGLLVAERLRVELPEIEVLELEGEPAGLIDAWDGADVAIVVDTVSSGSPPGTIHRVDATGRDLPGDVFRASTHALGLAEAVALARALGRLPDSLVVYGLEGAAFAVGETLSPATQVAVERVAALVREEVAGFTSGS